MSIMSAFLWIVENPISVTHSSLVASRVTKTLTSFDYIMTSIIRSLKSSVRVCIKRLDVRSTLHSASDSEFSL